MSSNQLPVAEYYDNPGGTALHDAAVMGNVERIKSLVNEYGDNVVNVRDNNGLTPMHVAAAGGQIESIKCLTDLKADVNAKDNMGNTPLFIAAPECIECLAELGADIEARNNDGQTPIFGAAAKVSGQIETMECLKKLGAKLNERSNNGKTALDLAIEFNENEVADWLRRNGVPSKQSDFVVPARFSDETIHAQTGQANQNIAELDNRLIAAFQKICVVVNRNIPDTDYTEIFSAFNMIVDKQILSTGHKQLQPLAMIYLGVLYCAGKGINYNREQGGKLIKEGMSLYKEKLDPNFCFYLSQLFYDKKVGGYENRAKELDEALKFVQMASGGGTEDTPVHIVICRVCKKEVSSKADSCPHCGDPYITEEKRRAVEQAAERQKLAGQIAEEKREVEEAEKAEILREQHEKENLLMAELDNIGNVLKMCFDNGREFKEKFNLLVEWNNCGGSGAQADSLWNQSYRHYGDSPLGAVCNHQFKDCPDDLLERLKMLREIHNNDRIDSMISAFKETSRVLDKVKETQREIKRRTNR